MLKTQQHVEVGNIPTYEDASPEFLSRRKEELRAGMRNPHLSAGEFFSSVFSRIAVTVVLAGWGTWNGVENLIVKNRWINKRLSTNHGQNKFIHDLELFKSSLNEPTREMAKMLINGEGANADEVKLVLQKILEHTKTVELTAGVNELVALQDKFKALPDLEANGKAMSNELRKLLETIRTKNPNAGTGQFATLWEGIEENMGKGANKNLNYLDIADKAIFYKREQVIERAVLDDNRKIIRNWRIPAMVVAVGGGALIAGAGSYRAALRDKALSQESELSHIERLERERHHKAQMAKENSAPVVT